MAIHGRPGADASGRGSSALLVGLWIGAGVVRLALLWMPGHAVDLAAFQHWALRLAEGGPLRFYTSGLFADYLPGYLLVLWPLGELLRTSPQLAPEVLKLPPAAADFVVAMLLARLGGPRGQCAAVSYLWNPAVLLAGPWWGQVEAVAMAWFLGSAWAWRRGRPGWAGVLFGLGSLTKPQYALGGLVLLLGVARGWPGLPVLGAAAGSCFATVVGCGLMFGLRPWDLVRLALVASATYPYGSVNALNLWYLLGLNWKPDGSTVAAVPAALWGIVLTLAPAVWAAGRVAGRGQVGLAALAAATVSAVMFFLATRMHERYLFPAVPLSLLAWALGRGTVGLWAALSGVLVANLAFGLAYLASFPQLATPGWKVVWGLLGAPVPQLVAVAGLVVAGWLVCVFAAEGRRERRMPSRDP